MMIKYRVREVAKDLNVPNKDVLDVLEKYTEGQKKYMTALTEPELDIVFESFTQKHSSENLDEYFAQRDLKKSKEPEKEAKNVQPKSNAPQTNPHLVRSHHKQKEKSHLVRSHRSREGSHR